MNFDAAFTKLLGHEGGYSNNPADPGGATNWGVTERVARRYGYTGDMKDYPQGQAKVVYLAEYWSPIQAEKLPHPIRYAMFDAAVNSGVSQAIKWLQRAVGATPDGQIGPQTLSFLSDANANAIKLRLLAARLEFMTGLPNWPTFSKGWARRVASLMAD